MKTTYRKFLVAGLLAGALTFVGCKSDKSAERTGETPDTMQTTPPPPPATTDQHAPPPAGTETNPGTGGSGGISKTKQSDDNLRMPEEDPLRTKEQESIRDSEAEPGVHRKDTDGPGTGGSGLGNDATPDDLNEGGNVDDTHRGLGQPRDTATPDEPLNEDSQIPPGAR